MGWWFGLENQTMDVQSTVLGTCIRSAPCANTIMMTMKHWENWNMWYGQLLAESYFAQPEYVVSTRSKTGHLLNERIVKVTHIEQCPDDDSLGAWWASHGWFQQRRYQKLTTAE